MAVFRDVGWSKTSIGLGSSGTAYVSKSRRLADSTRARYVPSSGPDAMPDMLEARVPYTAKPDELNI